MKRTGIDNPKAEGSLPVTASPMHGPRPPYFANRVLRLAIKTAFAQHYGTDAFALLSVIAMTEDARRYRGPVAFFNAQLLPLLGFRKWERLDRARKSAIEAGWLLYESQGSRRAGLYRTTIPPNADGLGDSAVDEGSITEPYPSEGDNQDGSSPSSPSSPPRPSPGNGYGEGEPSSLFPVPMPLPLKTGASLGQSEQLYQAYPRKVGKADALKAINAALKRETFDVLLEAVQAFAVSPKASSEFCPHPATWFKQERWKDDRNEWQRSASTTINGNRSEQRLNGSLGAIASVVQSGGLRSSNGHTRRLEAHD